jgi:TRAP-type C4-dicarboxylate transport system substrate-binding protein
MKQITTLRGAAIGLALAVLGSETAGAAEFDFKLHHFLSAKAPAHTKMLVPWAKNVEKNSGGRVHIEIYPSMTLGGRPPELVQQARDGVVDLVWTVNGYTPGLFPRTEVFELPFVYLNDPRATNLAMYDMFEQHLRQEFKGLEACRYT